MGGVVDPVDEEKPVLLGHPWLKTKDTGEVNDALLSVNNHEGL